MKIFALLLLVFTVPCTASAMSVEGYRKTRLDASSSDAVTNLAAKTTLIGYFQGMSDTLEIMRKDGKLTFTYGSATPTEICIPPSVKVTPALLRLATDGEVNDHKDMYASTDPEWERFALPTFSVLGFRRMFPCDAP